MIYEFLAKIGFTRFETWLAATLGTLYRNRILKNRPLEGKVGEVYMTRKKIVGSSKNGI